MGGKTHADNSAVVEEQKKQAANEALQEQQRQTRINVGLRRINEAYSGTPVTTPATYDWSNFHPGVAGASQLPTGYTAIHTTPKGYVAPATAAPGATAPSAWAIKGPDGKTYYRGDKVNYNQPVTDPTTGAPEVTGGVPQSIYDNYAAAYHNYYDPQLDQQYKAARDELTFRLARAGDLTGTAANTEVANLAQQNAQNRAMITNQADQGVANLKSQFASEKAKAQSQLYATNDPTIAANQATAAVRDISLQAPSLSPLTQLFNVAAVGGANILRGFNNQALYNQYNNTLPSRGGSGSIVG